MSPSGPPVRPELVRALVRRALEERLGLRSSEPASLHGASREERAEPAHPSHYVIAAGPECSEDMDFPLRKPCLIEPHRPCYNSGYCKKLGY